MKMEEYFYRTNLPHWQPLEGTFFVTYRLHGSVPKQVIERLKEDHERKIKKIEKERECDEKGLSPNDKSLKDYEYKKRFYEEQKRHYLRFDSYLDSKILNEPHWLKIPELAEVVAESLHHFDGQYYELFAYCIMSNHVHVLLKMMHHSPMLWKVLQGIKKYSARVINKKIGRTGRFWARGSYDHVVRQNEFDRILSYILNNPVKAGIVQRWDQYPFNYCREDLR